MELVSKKKLMLFAGQGHPSSPRRSRQSLDVPLGDGQALDVRQRRALRAATARASAAPTSSCCRPTASRSTTASCEQLHHDRRRQARVGASASPRSSPFYGYARQDRKAEGREPITARLARRPAHRRRRRPRRHRRPAHRPDPGLLRLPRRPPHRGAAARRLPAARSIAGEDVTSSRPTPAAASSPGASPNCLGEPTSRPSSRSSTSTARRARTTSPSPTRWSARSRAAPACSSTT